MPSKNLLLPVLICQNSLQDVLVYLKERALTSSHQLTSSTQSLKLIINQETIPPSFPQGLQIPFKLQLIGTALQLLQKCNRTFYGKT